MSSSGASSVNSRAVASAQRVKSALNRSRPTGRSGPGRPGIWPYRRPGRCGRGPFVAPCGNRFNVAPSVPVKRAVSWWRSQGKDGDQVRQGAGDYGGMARPHGDMVIVRVTIVPERTPNDPDPGDPVRAPTVGANAAPDDNRDRTEARERRASSPVGP